MEPPRPLNESETKIVRIFKQAAENHAAVKGIKTQWSIYHISREAGLDLSSYPKEGLIMQAVWIAFLSVMKLYTPDCELKYPTVAEFQIAYAGRFDSHNEHELNNLFQIANWMSILFTFVPAKKNKGFALTVVTKLIEGWYIKYVTGSGQTKATQDRVHVFEIEGNVRPSPRGKGGIKLMAGSMTDDSASTTSGSSYNSRSSAASSSSSGSPSILTRPLSPISSPRSGDQGIGHNQKRRKSLPKQGTPAAAGSFPAYGPEHSMFTVASTTTTSTMTFAAPAPQPAPAVATALNSMMHFSNGVSSKSSGVSGRGKGSGKLVHHQNVSVSSSLSTSKSMQSVEAINLFRSVSTFSENAFHTIISSAASDITDNENYFTETDCDDVSLGLCDEEEDIKANDAFFTLADVSPSTGNSDCLLCSMDDVYGSDDEFQEMLQLLRETSTSSNCYRQTSLSLPVGSSGPCCLLGLPEDDAMVLDGVEDSAKKEIEFRTVPSNVSLNELGPPLDFGTFEKKDIKSGFSVLGMSLSFGFSSAFDLFDHEPY